MATYVTPKRGVEFIFYVGLVSQSDTKDLQANPTLASGDVKVSKDGGAFANLNTLPAVTPASGTAVKVTVSATEMEADNLVITFIDAAGGEWCDLMVTIQTTARQIDDLAFPNTSGRGIDVDASGGVEVGSFQAGAITAAAVATGAIDADAIAADAANEIADALLDRADGIETGLTPRGAVRLIASSTAGKLSGAATTTVTTRNAVQDSKARITATVDADGNRSAITWDAT